MKTNIEAIAIKNLQEILRERGYSAEALFSKFDSDNDGTLSKNEFENALRSITGQTAPQAIVKAIFGALDEDSSGSLELDELLSIVESGPSQSFSMGQSISIESHPEVRFNGSYSQQEGQINNKPYFKNQNGCILYSFSSDSGSSPSWNLDDRDQDGSNDWYRGGWTRAPNDGSLPLGAGRWVGAGMITLSVIRGQGDSQEPPETFQDQDDPSGDRNLEGLIQEIDAASRYFEEQVSSGDMSIDQAIETANSAFERKIDELPAFLRSPARRAWDDQITELEQRLRENSPPPSTIAAGIGAVGTIGAIASKTSENLPSSPSPSPAVPEPEPPAVPEPEPPAVPEPEPPAVPEPEPPAVPDPEPPAAPEPEPPAAKGVNNFNLEAVISDFQSTRTLSERKALKDSLSGNSGTIEIRVSSIERTFGIGLSEDFRGGSTLIAKVEGVGDIEIRLHSALDTSQFKSGHETEILVSIVDWNAVRLRLVLEAS